MNDLDSEADTAALEAGADEERREYELRVSAFSRVDMTQPFIEWQPQFEQALAQAQAEENAEGDET